MPRGILRGATHSASVFFKENFPKKKLSIAGYYPSNFEVNILDFLCQASKKNFKVGLPVIKKNYKINFIQCSINDPFIVNQYGIPEPAQGKVVYPDILLVPLVAFDKNLNRLGYGAGYYDRLIQSLKKRKILLK